LASSPTERFGLPERSSSCPGLRPAPSAAGQGHASRHAGRSPAAPRDAGVRRPAPAVAGVTPVAAATAGGTRPSGRTLPDAGPDRTAAGAFGMPAHRPPVPAGAVPREAGHRLSLL